MKLSFKTLIASTVAGFVHVTSFKVTGLVSTVEDVGVVEAFDPQPANIEVAKTVVKVNIQSIFKLFFFIFFPLDNLIKFSFYVFILYYLNRFHKITKFRLGVFFSVLRI